jgi:hypothetical protein
MSGNITYDGTYVRAIELLFHFDYKMPDQFKSLEAQKREQLLITQQFLNDFYDGVNTPDKTRSIMAVLRHLQKMTAEGNV